MKTPWVIKQIEKITLDYIHLNCTTGKCYGVLAIHRVCFALALFHFILSTSLIGVRNTRTRRAEIQNGWWGPKVALWLVLLVVSFFIPNGFFIFWGNWVALLGSMVFILIGKLDSYYYAQKIDSIMPRSYTTRGLRPFLYGNVSHQLGERQWL